MNLFELAAFVGGITGAICGGILASAEFGAWGWFVGVPVGAAIGWVAFPVATLSFFVVGMFFEEGPRGLMKLMRTRRDERKDAPIVTPDK